VKKYILIAISIIIVLSLGTGLYFFYNKNQSEKVISQNTNMNNISLPQPKKDSDFSFERAIQNRRSRRSFTDQPLDLEQISQILWSAQGITDEKSGFRSAPSAGATYPLEVYLVVAKNGVNDLQAGIYHYIPKEHKLEKIVSEDVRQELEKAALGQSSVGQAPASIVIAGIYQRTTQKYGDRGERYVHIEVGHSAQNIYLQAEALGLGTVVIGAFHDDKVKELLNLDYLDLGDQQPLYIMPIGNY
jgi:SagB-type dehydrogenase family enzyme